MLYNRRYRSSVVAGAVAAAQMVYWGQHGQAAAAGAGSTCRPLCSPYRRLLTLHTGRAQPVDRRLLATSEAAAVEQDVGRRFATY